MSNLIASLEDGREGALSRGGSKECIAGDLVTGCVRCIMSITVKYRECSSREISSIETEDIAGEDEFRVCSFVDEDGV